MELVNAVNRYELHDAIDHALVHEALESVVLLLSPIVPHVCHKMWQQLGHLEAVIDAPWPVPDESARVSSRVTLVVQVNGKLRARVDLAADASKEEAECAALEDVNVQRFIAGKEIRKVIVVPGKLVNVVV
jgi:leucyl-tRNA synthetase